MDDACTGLAFFVMCLGMAMLTEEHSQKDARKLLVLGIMGIMVLRYVDSRSTTSRNS